MQPSKNGGKPRRGPDGKFLAGNKYGQGRKDGSRNKASLVAQELLCEHAEKMFGKWVDLALKGDRIPSYRTGRVTSFC